MKRPKITVMIPVYNMRDKIGRSIESVLSQKYENKELMILDGGSTDGSVAKILEYKEKIDYFISQKDNGPSSAMAANLLYSTGDYAAILGADDFYEPDALEAAAETIEKTNADVVYGDCNFWYSDGNKVRKCAKNRGLENLYYYNSLFTNAAFIRKELLIRYYENEWKKIKDDINISTDHLLWLLLYHEGKKFSYVPSKSALTNYAASGRSNTNEFRGCMDDAAIINMVIGDDAEAKARFMPTFNRYFAARSVLFYEKVIGKESFRKEILKYISLGKKYVIFGIGDMSRKVLRMLEICGIEPEYFVDNNYRFNSSDHLGYKVYSPVRLIGESDAIVIISVLGCEDKIREQIESMQIGSLMEIVNYSDLSLRLQNDIGIEILKESWKNGMIT